MAMPYSCQLRGIVTKIRSNAQVRAATIGRARSPRTARTARGSCTSIVAKCLCSTAATTAAATTVKVSVLCGTNRTACILTQRCNLWIQSAKEIIREGIDRQECRELLRFFKSYNSYNSMFNNLLKEKEKLETQA